MLKDYLPFSNELKQINEIDFLKEYWTRLWEKQELVGFGKGNIEKTDEFKSIAQYIEFLKPDSHILDGGCGLGDWTNYFISRGFNTFGVDISNKTIERLKEKFPQHKERFMVCDIRKTEFKSNFFDAYFSWGVFEHFENGLGLCLKEANRVLKAGAYLFITVPFQNHWHTFRNFKRLGFYDGNFDKELGYKSPMRFYQWRFTKRELQKEFEMQGFRAIEIKPINKSHGLSRLIKTGLGIDFSKKTHSAIKKILYPFILKDTICHTLIGIAVKRGD